MESLDVLAFTLSKLPAASVSSHIPGILLRLPRTYWVGGKDFAFYIVCLIFFHSLKSHCVHSLTSLQGFRLDDRCPRNSHIELRCELRYFFLYMILRAMLTARSSAAGLDATFSSLFFHFSHQLLLFSFHQGGKSCRYVIASEILDVVAMPSISSESGATNIRLKRLNSLRLCLPHRARHSERYLETPTFHPLRHNLLFGLQGVLRHQSLSEASKM